MFEAWLHFAIIIFVQAFLFVACAYHQKKLSDVPRILGWSVLIGIGFGVLVDGVGGRLFGLHSYVFGFDAFFLTLNWVFLNGFFAANILLMRLVRLPYFYLLTIVLVAVYEIPNYFFRVWTWEFALPPIEFLIVLSIGYFGGAVLIAAVWHAFLGYRFSFIDNLLGSKVRDS